MITVEMRGKVKRLYSREKKSLHEIAKTTGLSRKWVRETDEVNTRGDLAARQSICPSVTGLTQSGRPRGWLICDRGGQLRRRHSF